MNGSTSFDFAQDKSLTIIKRRVVVTGMGVISPIGNSVEEFWSNLKAGVSGIDKLTGLMPPSFLPRSRRR
jgi:3-oxoacyl-[acyl-carrier-protein] synthase II